MSLASERAARLVGRFGKVRVLVVGDLILDQFIWGRVDRISPEAPVPVVHVTGESFRLGGAANVVSNVLALGGQAVACGVVGNDAAGRRLRDELNAVGAGTEGICVTRQGSTTRKTRIIAHQQQVVRLDREEGVSERVAARARTFALEHLSDADVVIVSDYGKGMISAGFLSKLAAARERYAFRLVVDPKSGG